VSLSARDGSAVLRVTDAGTGFATTVARDGAGLGLIAMQQRAELSHGTLAITSRPGAGTTVTAVFPCAGAT
jgi:signal transduction histidine kinase